MLWGDGAFDSDPWHQANWEDRGVSSYAPTRVPCADRHVNGLCQNLFQAPVREYGSTLRSVNENNLVAQAALKVVFYAIKG